MGVLRCEGETIEKAIAPHIPGLRARVETSFALAQGGKVLAVVPPHARFVDGLHHLRQAPRTAGAIARGCARTALTLTRRVVPVPVGTVALSANGVDDVLAGGGVCPGEWSGGALEVGYVQFRPGITVTHWITALIWPPPPVKLKSNLNR